MRVHVLHHGRAKLALLGHELPCMNPRKPLKSLCSCQTLPSARHWQTCDACDSHLDDVQQLLVSRWLPICYQMLNFYYAEAARTIKVYVAHQDSAKSITARDSCSCIAFCRSLSTLMRSCCVWNLSRMSLQEYTHIGAGLPALVIRREQVVRPTNLQLSNTLDTEGFFSGLGRGSPEACPSAAQWLIVGVE